MVANILTIILAVSNNTSSSDIINKDIINKDIKTSRKRKRVSGWIKVNAVGASRKVWVHWKPCKRIKSPSKRVTPFCGDRSNDHQWNFLF